MAEESLALNSKANDPRYNSNSEVGLAILANEDRTREKIEMLTEDNDRVGAATAAVSSHQQRKNADRSKSKSENTKKTSAAADAYLQSMQQKKTQNEAKKKTTFLSSSAGGAARAAPEEEERNDNEQPAFFTPRHAAPIPLDEQQQDDMFAPLHPFQGAQFPRPSLGTEAEEQPPRRNRDVDDEPDALFMPEGGFFGTKSPPAPGIIAANGTAPITIDNNITTASPARGGNTVSASEDEAEENAEKAGDLRQKMDNLGAATANKVTGGYVPVQMSTGGLASLPSLPALTSDRSPAPQKNFSRKRESDDEDVDDKPPRKQQQKQQKGKEKDAEHSAASSYYYYSTESESDAGGEVDQYGVRQPKPLSSSRNSGGSHRRHRRHHHGSSSRRQEVAKKEPTYEDFQAEIQRKVKEEEETEKREMLMLFYEKEQYEGIKMTRKFTMQSDLNEMRWWYYKLIRDCRINDEVEHMKNNLVQGSRFLLFINSTVLNNPLNLRMNDFPKELSKKLNTEWDRHLRDYVKSKCGISGPKPNPIRNLAWSVVNTAINYHRNQLALEEQEEIKRKREFEKAQAAAGMPPIAPSPMMPQQSAYRAFTQPGAPSPFFAAGFGGMPPIDNSASLEEQYKQLEQWQLFQRQQFLQQQQQQMQQRAGAGAGVIAATSVAPAPAPVPSVRQQQQQPMPRTSPMYAMPLQQQMQAQQAQQAQQMPPAPKPQQMAPSATLTPNTLPNMSMSAAPRSPPPPTFSTQRDALRAAVTSGGTASDLPSFMRPPQTRTAAVAARPQDFRLPMPGNNRLNSAVVAAPVIGETATTQRQTITAQQQQQQQQRPPQPKNALAPPSVNARAPFMQAMPQLPQSPTSRTQPTMLSRADESRVLGVQLPQAPSPRLQPVDIDKLEQMQQQMYQKPAVDPGTVPFLFQPPRAVPPPAPPTQRTTPPSPIRTVASTAAASTANSVSSTPSTTMRAATPLPMLARPMLPMQPRTASTPAQPQRVPAQPQPQPQQQQPQQQRVPGQPPQPTLAQRPVPPASSTIRQPLPPPSSLSALRQPLPPPPSLARKAATTEAAAALPTKALANQKQDAEETVTITSATTKKAERHHNNNVQLTLVEEQQAPLVDEAKQVEEEAVAPPPPQKSLDEMSYDEIMADLQRQYDEDDSEQEYDDLVAGHNGAPVMAEVQANDKVSEVMGLMSDFVEKNPGAGKQPEKQSNLYDDLDTLLQASDADTESGMSSIADISTIRSSKSAASGTKTTRRRPQRASAATSTAATATTTTVATVATTSTSRTVAVASTPKRAQTSTSGSDSDASGGGPVATPSKKKKVAGTGGGGTPNKKKKDNDAIGVGGNVTLGPKGTMMFATSPKKLQPQPRSDEK